MALLTVEIPERLLAKLKRTGRPAQEVIVEALEETFDNEVANEEIALLAAQGLEQEENKLGHDRARKPASEDLPREEIVRRLIEAGFVRRPEEFDSPATREWLALSEQERQQHIKAMEEVYFPDALASRIIIRNRKRFETDVPRQEVVRRLVATSLIRSPGSWDTEAARQWRQLPEEEQQKLIDEVTALYFPDSPASKFLIEEVEV